MLDSYIVTIVVVVIVCSGKSSSDRVVRDIILSLHVVHKEARATFLTSWG